jgi:hypothetical protein
MRHSHQDALDRWLDAERNDRTGEAEAALLALFEALPEAAMAAPPAGFADRVLVRAGLQAAAPADLFAWRPLRIVLALCLAATGFGALWLPPVLRALAGLWSVGGLVRIGVRATAEAARGLASLLRLWDLLLTLGRAVAQPLAVPQVMAILVVALLASSLAFRYLRDQLSVDQLSRPLTGERN